MTTPKKAPVEEKPIPVAWIAFGILVLVLGYVLFVYLPKQQESFSAQLDEIKEQQANQESDSKEEPEQTVVAAPATVNTPASIIKRWSPRVGAIVCNFRYTDGSVYYAQSGTVSLITSSIDAQNTRYSALTNRHVIEYGANGATDCSVLFPGSSTIYTITDPGSVAYAGGGVDAVALVISNPDTYLRNLPIGNKSNACQTTPDLGEEIIVLGYPGIGSNRTITATEGIISGIEDSHYVTSAKIEHGNSGGLAILVKDNCVLGVPTFAQTGTVESLARILKWQAISLINR
jgi:hypothetical protein